MIYILTVLLCMYCSYHYDVRGNTRYKDRFYRLILWWFIMVSGFAYMIGSDTPIYMDNFKALKFNTISLNNIINYDARYQPGWMLLCYLCRFFTDNFLILKIPIAVFLNFSVFAFFKKNTPYIFTAVLIYALLDYLVLNFNVLRHSIALGFALYAISAIRDGKWRHFLLFTVGAYMFHNSALLLLVFPIVKFFKANKYSVAIILSLFVSVIYILLKIDLNSLMADVLVSGYLDEGISQVGQGYLNSERLGGQEGFAIFSLTRLLIFVTVVYYLVYYKDKFWGVFGIAYILFLIITGFMPILWRYRLYVDFPFIIMVSRVIVELANKQLFSKNRIIIASILYSLVLFIFTKDLFSKPVGEKFAAIDQYYPYHSVFNPQINREQMNYFQSLGN